ncbi:MAG: hypothetical protein EHM58_16070 [Ignavibacteriae bacterium]|nr:MAG: hypothetical protein EHM58_16070 [Ignavibacteriota bacterium]
MTGIKFVVDEKGDKSAVMIDLKRYGKLWEDFYDTLKAKSRKKEPKETFASVRARITKAKS